MNPLQGQVWLVGVRHGQAARGKVRYGRGTKYSGWGSVGRDKARIGMASCGLAWRGRDYD